MTKQRVLIVDDEPDIRELIEITLLRMGLETHCAADYSAATRLLKEIVFDLCLTDMKLPDGDGIALVEHIQQHCPNTPTAVITAHGSIDLAIKSMKAGQPPYLCIKLHALFLDPLQAYLHQLSGNSHC